MMNLNAKVTCSTSKDQAYQIRPTKSQLTPLLQPRSRSKGISSLQTVKEIPETSAFHNQCHQQAISTLISSMRTSIRWCTVGTNALKTMVTTWRINMNQHVNYVVHVFEFVNQSLLSKGLLPYILN
ncbi:hypothetical protein AVEN_191265-1 [Araneus ventricosus]|uniref:Uncharacterized protein n=1 Tax=Araneus ventricosus TaxID=182803 RepID=A0A4Y2KL05_ARAVE|nr:hypothetical protein AVEN_191265-1 [Araneus ventricosus]